MIEFLVMPELIVREDFENPSYIINGKDFLEKLKLGLFTSGFPLIYGWKRNGIFLYIGQSTMGVFRFNNHHVINVKDKVLEGDEILIIRCESNSILDKLEYHLIKQHKPLHNITHNG